MFSILMGKAGMPEATTERKADRLNTFDRTNGRDEMNIAEFPIVWLGKIVPADQKSIVREDTVFDEPHSGGVGETLACFRSGRYRDFG